jgi:acetolactate synthase-1/2/3 large subunit
MKVKGNELVARALQREGVETLFFLMGGPTLGVAAACIAAGLRMIDVRHEQAGAMMAHAQARVRGRAGVCMASSGPGVTNLVTGLANALFDCAPVVALGGCSPVGEFQTGYFQEIDQVAIMRPVTKWAERCYETRRIPEYIALAFSQAMSGKPGPVYLDLPGDVLYAEVEEDEVRWGRPLSERQIHKPAASAEAISQVLDMVDAAERPLILSGSGVFWSGASEAMTAAVESFGIPFYTTPQGRGALPDDHPLTFAAARSLAMREADLVIVVGTRLNYMFGYGKAPRFAADAKFVRIDIDPAEIGTGQRADVGIVADAGTALKQLTAEGVKRGARRDRFHTWHRRLHAVADDKATRQLDEARSDSMPIHPLRLCTEVREFMDRDAILVVDGAEILNYARQSIPTFVPCHRLNSGPFGTMGVGLPFGLGAKAAKPAQQVIVLHGDGSFGLNGMELDTAIRHNLPVLVVISLNGGWSADPTRTKPGRDLGYTRFDQMAQALGCHGEHVERPEQIRPALERAMAQVREGRTAVVNVVTDWAARSSTANFTTYVT